MRNSIVPNVRRPRVSYLAQSQYASRKFFVANEDTIVRGGACHFFRFVPVFSFFTFGAPCKNGDWLISGVRNFDNTQVALTTYNYVALPRGKGNLSGTALLAPRGTPGGAAESAP